MTIVEFLRALRDRWDSRPLPKGDRGDFLIITTRGTVYAGPRSTRRNRRRRRRARVSRRLDSLTKRVPLLGLVVAAAGVMVAIIRASG